MKTAYTLTLSIVIAALGLGCTAELPDGRFACMRDTDCPAGFSCTAGLCHRAGTDAGMPIDTGGTDAFVPGDDAFVPGDDAATCSDCVTITVTNAYGASAEGKAYMLEDQALSSPPYGETYGPYVVSLSDAQLDVTGGLGDYTFNTVVAGGSYVAAIAWDTAASAQTFVLFPAPLGSPMTGHTTIRPVDLIADMDTHAMDDGIGGATLLGRAAGMHDYDLTDGVAQSLMLYRFDLGTAGTGLAALDTSLLPTGAAYYVFVAGRTDVHLGAESGIRFIPAVPGSSALASLPIAWAMNTTATKVEICDGTQLLLTLAPMELRGAIAGTVAARNLQVRDATSMTGCTSTTVRTFTSPDLPLGLVSARMLIGVIGVVGPGPTAPWGAGGGYEGPPGTMPGGQVVTYANGVPSTMLDFGVSGMTMAVSVPMLLSASYEWPAPPPELIVTYGGLGQRRFAWDPITTAASVVALTDGTTFGAYEISMPFGRDWTFMAEGGAPFP